MSPLKVNVQATVKTNIEGGINKLGVFILLIIAGATAGSIPTAGKIAMQTGLTPLALLFFRYTIAFAFMYPIIVKRNELSWKDLDNNCLPGLLSVMNPIVLFYALSHTTASVAILIYAAGPLLMGSYHRFYCKTELSRNQVLGLAIGFAGVALILLQPISNSGVGTIQGNMMVLISTMFFVSYTVIAGKQQSQQLVSPYSLVFYSSIIAMVLSFFPMLQGVAGIHVGFAQLAAIIWLGFISTVVFFILFQFIVKREGTLVASVYAYLQATLGAIIGLVVLNEQLTTLIAIGTILTFSGAKIATIKVTRSTETKEKK